jgi:hypothetical protein
LELEAMTAPVDVIVVDDVQQPTLDEASAASSSAESSVSTRKLRTPHRS